MLNIDIMKAGECFHELVAQSINGNEVVITRNNQPIVKLVLITGQQKRKRPFGSAKGLIMMSDDFDEPLDDFKDYM